MITSASAMKAMVLHKAGLRYASKSRGSTSRPRRTPDRRRSLRCFVAPICTSSTATSIRPACRLYWDTKWWAGSSRWAEELLAMQSGSGRPPWLGRSAASVPTASQPARTCAMHPSSTATRVTAGLPTHMVAAADFVIPLNGDTDPISLAPLLCAGLIGWRCLTKAGEGQRIGIAGFGAAAHITIT